MSAELARELIHLPRILDVVNATYRARIGPVKGKVKTKETSLIQRACPDNGYQAKDGWNKSMLPVEQLKLKDIGQRKTSFGGKNDPIVYHGQIPGIHEKSPVYNMWNEVLKDKSRILANPDFNDVLGVTQVDSNIYMLATGDIVVNAWKIDKNDKYVMNDDFRCIFFRERYTERCWTEYDLFCPCLDPSKVIAPLWRQGNKVDTTKLPPDDRLCHCCTRVLEIKQVGSDRGVRGTGKGSHLLNLCKPCLLPYGNPYFQKHTLSVKCNTCEARGFTRYVHMSCAQEHTGLTVDQIKEDTYEYTCRVCEEFLKGDEIPNEEENDSEDEDQVPDDGAKDGEEVSNTGGDGGQDKDQQPNSGGRDDEEGEEDDEYDVMGFFDEGLVDNFQKPGSENKKNSGDQGNPGDEEVLLAEEEDDDDDGDDRG